MPVGEPTRPVAFRLNARDRATLERLARERGMCVSDVVREALSAVVQEHLVEEITRGEVVAA